MQEKGRASPDGARCARWEWRPERAPQLLTSPPRQGRFKGTAWLSQQMKHLMMFDFLLMVNNITKVSQGKINNPPKISLLRPDGLFFQPEDACFCALQDAPPDFLK